MNIHVPAFRSCIPRVLLCAIGLAAGLLIGEAALRVARGAPPAVPEDFRQLYLDIYKDFFITDPTGTSVVGTRDGQPCASFPVRRGPDRKLVFIIGESVAKFNDDRYLQRRFSSIFPEYQWDIVNTGRLMYDSYRLRLVARDILRYRPDLLILMMGNNPSLKPQRVATFPYRGPLARFWTPRLLAQAVMPDVMRSPRESLRDFGTHTADILAMAHRNRIPVVVCILPQNNRFPFLNYFQSRETFGPWWSLWRDPSRLLREGTDDAWLAAAARERTGQVAAAAVQFRRRDLNADMRGTLRAAAARFPNAVVVDFAASVDRHFQGYDVFSDICHYWAPVYGLLADDICARLYEHRGMLGLPADEARWQRFFRSRVTPDDIRPAIRAYIAETVPGKIENADPAFFVDHHLYAGVIECLRYVSRSNPAVIRRIVQRAISRPAGEGNAAIAGRLVLLGEMLREEGRTRDALRCFDRASGIDPENHQLYLFRGLCRYDRGDEPGAARDFATLARMDPRSSWLTCGYIRALEQGPDRASRRSSPRRGRTP